MYKQALQIRRRTTWVREKLNCHLQIEKKIEPKSCIFCFPVHTFCVGESVFKANVQRSETQDAELVQESKGKLLCIGGICEPDDVAIIIFAITLSETEIEKPVDHEEAQEVEEEEEEKEEAEKEKKSGTHAEQSAEQVNYTVT